MPAMWRRTATLASVALLQSGCTFGVLKQRECLDLYTRGMSAAVASAQANGPVEQEGYAFCLDGKARAQAMVPLLQRYGYEVVGPTKHFEVPGGWCLGAKRRAMSAPYDASGSLHTICALGQASRAYLTGGSITAVGGQTSYIRSTYELDARQDHREDR